MANRLALDPALAGGFQSRQYDTEKANDTFAAPHRQSESFRADAAAPTSGYDGAAPQSAQPYYQYPGPGQQNVAPPMSVGQDVQQSPGYVAHCSSNQQSPGEDATAAAQDDAKRQRACEACRGLKVRCDQDPARPDIPCKRCAKAGRNCVITQPSRKRQKKADSRVAELEKKLDALTAALQRRDASGSMAMSSQPPGDTGITSPVHPSPTEPLHHNQPGEYMYGPADLKRRRPDWDTPLDIPASTATELSGLEPSETRTSSCEVNYDDLKARIEGIMPSAQAAGLFKRYSETMSPYLPMVVFPPDTDAKAVFRDRPVLYLAIITAASGSLGSRELSHMLYSESISTIVDCVFKDGTKSLELIQAMLILSGWFKAPALTHQNNFYQLIHMAAIMALEVDLGKKYYPLKTKVPAGRSDITFSMKLTNLNSDSLDARRAWLGCYYLCATSSMVLRRPNLVRWTQYMEECIEVLETSSDACPSDKNLCQHVKIQHICDEIGLQFLMWDNTAQVSINDPGVTYALVTLENQLKSWKQQVPEALQCAGLTFFEHVTSLYLHEIALHFNHNVDDFRLPFTEQNLKNVDRSSNALTQNQIAAIEACLRAAHGILDTMINFTPDELRALPLLLFFVRCIYALMILLKMHIAINTTASELGKLLHNADLKLDHYFDTLFDIFTRINSLPKDKPEKALQILQRLREWFHQHRGGSVSVPQGNEQSFAQKYDQTPLHMLSQVATGRQGTSHDGATHTDWTYNSPNVLIKQSPAELASQKPQYQNSQSGMSMPAANGTAYNSNLLGIMDATNQQLGLGWGSGFEQAMDIALGSMGELQGGALDSWLLGESAAPLALNDPIGGPSHGNIGQW